MVFDSPDCTMHMQLSVQSLHDCVLIQNKMDGRHAIWTLSVKKLKPLILEEDQMKWRGALTSHCWRDLLSEVRVECHNVQICYAYMYIMAGTSWGPEIFTLIWQFTSTLRLHSKQSAHS